MKKSQKKNDHLLNPSWKLLTIFVTCVLFATSLVLLASIEKYQQLNRKAELSLFLYRQLSANAKE